LVKKTTVRKIWWWN